MSLPMRIPKLRGLVSFFISNGRVQEPIMSIDVLEAPVSKCAMTTIDANSIELGGFLNTPAVDNSTGMLKPNFDNGI